MKYHGLIQNDLINNDTLCVTFILQGCPDELKPSYKNIYHNYEQGENVPEDIRGRIVKAISDNNMTRDFNILGGEPFFDKNLELVLFIILAVRAAYPNIKITIWTKYLFEELITFHNETINEILQKINCLIDARGQVIKLDEIEIL